MACRFDVRLIDIRLNVQLGCITDHASVNSERAGMQGSALPWKLVDFFDDDLEPLIVTSVKLVDHIPLLPPPRPLIPFYLHCTRKLRQSQCGEQDKHGVHGQAVARHGPGEDVHQAVEEDEEVEQGER